MEGREVPEGNQPRKEGVLVGKSREKKNLKPKAYMARMGAKRRI